MIWLTMHALQLFYFQDDYGLNQFVVRVFDLNENITEPKYLPKYEYNLEKVTKYFQIDSSNIRMQ